MVDAHVVMLLPVLIPPGPAGAVLGRVREGVQVLDGLPVGEGAGGEGAGGVEFEERVGFAEDWVVLRWEVRKGERVFLFIVGNEGEKEGRKGERTYSPRLRGWLLCL